MEKLIIRTTRKSKQGNKTFKVPVNPYNFKHEHGINYDHTSQKGSLRINLLNSRNKFAGYQTEKTSFDITLDDTGAIPDSKSVVEQIDSLKNVTYHYNGKKHEPEIVLIKWGSFIFVGRLTNLNVNYTLFSSEGKPLRAVVSLSFIRYTSVEEQAKEAKQSSPDLTHVIEFKSGDSLPLLCHEIYQDSSYYMEVARHNNLESFRNIKPGTQLYFPPLS